MRRWRRLRCAGRWRIRFQKTALFRVIVDGDGGCGGGQHLSSGENASDSSVIELEKVKMEMKMMEAALQGAARQAQAKADEIAKFMNENEQLKSAIEDLKVCIL
ncbi:PREDICTED: golgin [Prunus dulcis]|uniref:PREDICTED: golgin n=1 Tax=Prunus dulcis TaxID=3755 RepID=A0A5E4FF42_PRUDU|nr:PREDICTED: golgin [Prunus dulcis]